MGNLINKTNFYREKAQKYLETKKYEEALSLINLALEMISNKTVNEVYPGETELYEFRAQVFYKKKKYKKAISDFNKAIDISKNDVYEIEKNDTSCANFDLYMNLTKTYLSIKEYRKALKIISQLIKNFSNKSESKKHPKLPELYKFRAEIFLELKNYDKAEMDYNKAVELLTR